nr:ribonuclease H-like domain-containing protein [Tanacetum cinerariifolium]
MLSFIRPFRCPVTIFNTIDHLGKFDGKADEGFFVGYSLNRKAFRVFNSRIRIVEETLHIRFSENTPNNVGSKPNWLFDIDAITKTINYQPVVTDTQSNGNAGTKDNNNAGQARKEKEPGKDYILIPLWTANPPFLQEPKSSQDTGFKPSNDVGKKAVHKEGGDSLVRATTTASSLEAKQDGGNIDKTQTKATSNEPSFQETSSERRVKKLEKKQTSRTHKLKRLYTVGLTARVISSSDDEGLGEEDASKQGRIIYDLDPNEDITLVNDQEMFDVDKDLQGEEVVVEHEDHEEPSESRTTTTIYLKKSQDKGKAKMIEEPVKLKKKDQILFDEEVARKLQGEINETELVVEVLKKDKVTEGSLKRTREELEQENAKKQKMEDDKEFAELKQCLEIIPDDGDNRVNHKNFAKNTHPCPERNIVPRAVLMKSGIKSVNAAKQIFSKAAVTVNTARPVNTAHPKTTMNAAKPSEEVPKVVKKDNGALIFEDWKLDDEDKSVPQPKM